MKTHEILSLSNLPGEKWMDVIGYESIYQVSNLGRIKGLERIVVDARKTQKRREHIMKQRLDAGGYCCVGLRNNRGRKQLFVHRVVATAFLCNSGNKPEINHINGITSDNRVENLEWCTGGENIQHSYDKLGRKGPRSGKFGKDNPRSMPVICYSKEGAPISEYDSAVSASKATGILGSSICNCIYGKYKTAGGFVWKRK